MSSAGPRSFLPWQTTWPVDVGEFFVLAGNIILCYHDLCASRLSCRFWSDLCGPRFVECPLRSPSDCATCRGHLTRLTSILVGSGARSRFSMSNVCAGDPVSMEDHLSCVKILLARDGQGRHEVAERLDLTGVDLGRHWVCLRAVAERYLWTQKTLALACRGGFGRVPEVEALLVGLKPQRDFGPRDLANAAATGSLAYTLFVKDKVRRDPDDVCVRAAEGGNVEIFEMFASHSVLCRKVSRTAVRRGHLQLVQHLVSRRCPMDTLCCHDAARSGHLQCLKFLHESGFPIDSGLGYAAYTGNCECLRYYLDNGARPPATPSSYGYSERGAGCLRMMLECGLVGPKLSAASLVLAALCGDLEQLRALCEFCGESDDARVVEVCRVAAERGHLSCLWCLHTSGWPWDSTVCEAAAQSGQLACLKYAHENGCPWDHKSLRRAKAYGHLSCIRYMHARGLTSDDDPPKTCGPNLSPWPRRAQQTQARK